MGGVQAWNKIGVGVYSAGKHRRRLARRHRQPQHHLRELAVAQVGGSGSGNQITRNYIGTDAAGSFPVANLFGVAVRADNNQLVENLVSGNTDRGIFKSMAPATTL